MKSYISIVICLTVFTHTIAQQKWSLDQCISHAKEHNLDIVNQKLLNKKAEEDITIARGDRLPNLTFSGSQSYSLGSSLDVSTGIGRSESRSNSFTLSSSLTLFNGFKKKYNLQQAKLLLEKGEADKDRLTLEMSLNITDLYLEILFNKEILEVAEEQVLISEQEVQRLKSLYDQGHVSKNEYLDIQSTVALDKKEIILAQNNVSNSLIRLKELLDIEDILEFDIIPIEDFTQIQNSLQNVEQLYQDALSNNPTILSTNLEAQINEKTIQIAQSDLYPSINFNYSFSSFYFHIQGSEDVIFNPTTGTFIENGFFTQLDNNKIHFIGLNLSVPIFNRLLTRSTIEKAQVDYEITQALLKNQSKELKNRIRIAVNDVSSALSSKNATTIAVETQEESFEIVRANYRAGNVSSYDFLESKNNHLRAQSENIRAKYEYFLKSKYLEYLISQ